MAPLSLERALIAVAKVRERLLRATAALERHGVPHAVIGGHAVAVWVARVDEDAVRNTVDVDILQKREDLANATAALAKVGFEDAEDRGVPLFIETASPSPKRGVHLVFAGEKVRAHEAHPAPTRSASDRAADRFAVIDLKSLLTMKLTAFRDKDRVHLRDMLDLDMITPDLESQFPADLRARLDIIRANPEKSRSRRKFRARRLVPPPASPIFSPHPPRNVARHSRPDRSRPMKRPAINPPISLIIALSVAAAGCGTTDSWKLLGNLNTDPATDFLGTRDGQPLELRVNGARALLIQPAATPNLIGGHESNAVNNAAYGAAIAGGGTTGQANIIYDNFNCIGGGENNVAGTNDGNPASAQFATIGGGDGNVASAEQATVAGGSMNVAAGVASTVGGGQGHRVTGDYATIAGGIDNDCPGGQSFVGGGTNNNVVGSQSAVVGGGGNTVAGQLAGIVSGAENSASGEYAFIGAGLQNQASDDGAFVGAGSTNNAMGAQSAIAAGSGNTTNASNAFVGAGAGNAAGSAASAVVAGDSNSAQSSNAFIGAGAGNTVTSTAADAVVCGGNANTAAADQTFIGGGSSNAAPGTGAVVVGGSTNLSQAQRSFVGGGSSNNANAPATEAVIAGGNANTAAGQQVFIGAGKTNIAAGDQAAIVAGNGNVAVGVESFIGAGTANQTPALQSVVVGGLNNIASGPTSGIVGGSNQLASAPLSFIGGGNANQATSSGAVIGGGQSNVASGIDSVIAGGNSAMTQFRGQFALASGAFATPGDAQTAIYVLRNTSTDDNSVELFLDGAGERLFVLPGRSATFDCMVVGRASIGLTLGFHFSGVIANIGGTTSIVGTQQTLNSDVDGGLPGANVVVDADDANDALRVTVNGAIGFSFRWVATIRTAEVAF